MFFCRAYFEYISLLQATDNGFQHIMRYHQQQQQQQQFIRTQI